MSATLHLELARPPRPARLPRSLPFLRAMQANFISVWPDDAYARDVTHVRVGRRHMFVANAPALIRHVLLDNAANYHKSPVARRLFEPALGQGLLTSEGETWRRHRQMVAPIFSQRRMAALVPTMVEEVLRTTEPWRSTAGATFDLAAALSDITLRIITATMFGAESHAETTSFAADSDAYQLAVRPSVLDFFGAPDWVPRPGMRTARAVADRLTATIHRIVAHRRAMEAPRDDLLALLIQAMDRDGVTLKEIRDEIATVFAAGHGTTAAVLTWCFYLLDRHPEAEQRLLDELGQVLEGRLPTATDVERLRFTRMVVEEAMRLYPPAHSITRLALGPDRLGDTVVPKDAVVIVSPWLTHRNPRLWSAPDQFDPDRFDPDRAAGRPRYAYFPFGAGARICVGASFAMTEAVVVLATLVQRWRVRLAPDHPVEPVALITLRPRLGLKATVEPRSASAA